jgi:hypothetical protein
MRPLRRIARWPCAGHQHHYDPPRAPAHRVIHLRGHPAGTPRQPALVAALTGVPGSSGGHTIAPATNPGALDAACPEALASAAHGPPAAPSRTVPKCGRTSASSNL